MSEEQPSSWKDVSLKKTTLGFVASCVTLGAVIAWQGSLVVGRISDLERSVQHFDNGITSVVEEDMDELRQQMRVLDDSMDNLNTLRAADLERNTPQWITDEINNRLIQVEAQMNILLEDED
jgi:hypothetical protein